LPHLHLLESAHLNADTLSVLCRNAGRAEIGHFGSHVHRRLPQSGRTRREVDRIEKTSRGTNPNAAPNLSIQSVRIHRAVDHIEKTSRGTNPNAAPNLSIRSAHIRREVFRIEKMSRGMNPNAAPVLSIRSVRTRREAGLDPDIRANRLLAHRCDIPLGRRGYGIQTEIPVQIQNAHTRPADVPVFVHSVPGIDAAFLLVPLGAF